MFDFLFQLHEVYLFLLLCGVGVVVSIIAVLLVKRFIPLSLRYAENPVLGNMSALISIIYGVLAGITALYLINSYSDSTTAVQREANATANIYRQSYWLAQPLQENLQKNLAQYLQEVINIEWPLMKLGDKITDQGDKIIDNMSLLLKQANAVAGADTVTIHELIGELKTLYNARQDRIAASYLRLNPEFWIVIIIGTFLTVMINYLFGMNFYLHLATVSAVTIMAFSMIFLLVALDRPFQGEYVIEPDAFKPLLMQIEKSNNV